MLLSVSTREFATILAALRYWQANERNTASEAVEYDIASDGGQFEPLGNDEIDALCEQLNVRATATSEEQMARLLEKADAAGLEPEDLDEIVHEFAASIAADVNNGGLDDQIRYLIDGMGVQQTERQLDELIERQPREEEE